jgi:Domain of unknown function (DUF4159)
MSARRILSLLGLPAVLTIVEARAESTAKGSSGFDRGEGTSLVRIEEGVVIDENSVRTAREIVSHSTGTPEWTNPPGFEKDVFTFARVIFKSGVTEGRRAVFDYGRSPRLGWWVDFPDADLNFSYRLQQVTSIRTDPEGQVLRLTDPNLTDYPLLYMVHAGNILLSDAEVKALSRYLQNGGVVFANDFWSAHEWEGFELAMRRVLPGRQWVELGTDHPIFRCVYNLQGPMDRLRVPTLQFWNRNHDPQNPQSPLQRVDRGPGSETMHVRAWLDDRQRISVLAIHNSDISDGWEREGENPEFFQKFSEKIAYPLGINIVFYVMTH